MCSICSLGFYKVKEEVLTKWPVSLLTKSSEIAGIHPAPTRTLQVISEVELLGLISSFRNGFLRNAIPMCANTSSSDWPKKACNNLGKGTK